MQDARHPTSRPLTRGVIAVMAAALPSFMTSHAAAQSQVNQPTLKRVEQGREDTGPLARSIRVAPTDLRLPIGFDQVYRLERGNKDSRGDLYARRSGGITAVFPRSQYSVSASGSLLPEIPPGTTFYIGNLPDSITRSAPSKVKPLPDTFVDRSARPMRADASTAIISAQATGATARSAAPSGTAGSIGRSNAGAGRELVIPAGTPVALPAQPSPARPSVFTDEDYRARRLKELLDKAAQTPVADAMGRAPESEVAAPAASANEKPRR